MSKLYFNKPVKLYLLLWLGQFWSTETQFGVQIKESKLTIVQLESIQRRFIKCIIGIGGLQYTERLEALKLLGYRTLRGDLIKMFKMTYEMTI